MDQAYSHAFSKVKKREKYFKISKSITKIYPKKISVHNLDNYVSNSKNT